MIKMMALLAALSMITGCFNLHTELKCHDGYEYTRWHVTSETKGITQVFDPDGKPVLCKKWINYE